MKLYRSTKDSTQWFAFGRNTGWLIFPPEVDGWQKRKMIPGINPIDMREVPIRMGFNTGFPGAPMLARARALDLRLETAA